MRNLFVVALLLTCLGYSGRLSSVAFASDTLVQVSTIDALLAGLYEGVISIETLKSKGDLGIGTFDALDGEMVVLDGQVYRVSSDGRAAVVSNQETTPFAGVTFFAPEQEILVPPGTDLEAFRSLVDAAVPSPNLFYAFRLDGHFKTVSTRSVPRQSKPYEPLVEVVKNQPVFDFQEVDGVLVGFYCPSFVKGVNVPGYHLHFLTSDKKAGGHVLGFTADRVKLNIDILHRFEMQLPENDGFARVDLQQDRKQELQKVEK